VAHFHYVLFGGAIFGLFSGIYYWFPKFTGKLMDEKLGKLHFWLMMIGFNLAFGPMHILGLKGMLRRNYVWQAGKGWELWNMVSTIGAFMIAFSMLVFMANWSRSKKRGKQASADPWDGRTLEWTIPSPPPEYNFAEVPTVSARDDFWHKKYTEDKTGRPVPVPVGGADNSSAEAASSGHEGAEHEAGHGIHLPSPSYFPLVAALGLPIMSYGVMFRAWTLLAAGVVVSLVGFYGWILEPATAEEH